MENNQIVVIAWSPIGYETYLAFLEIYGHEKVILVASRNFNPPEAQYHFGGRHDFFNQTDADTEISCAGLKQLFVDLRSRGGDFTLVAPQMGNFYVRSVIESEYCKDVIIYDEGRAAYGEKFQTLSRNIWLRRPIKSSEALTEYFNSAMISIDAIKKIYSSGVKFYEFSHRKIRSLISFFPEAFPGFNKVIISMMPMNNEGDVDFSNDVLILLPPIKLLRQAMQYDRYRQDIKMMKAQRSHCHFILKPHPADIGITLGEYFGLLAIDDAELYDSFMSNKGLNIYREPAIIGFHTIITYNNSTEIYIKQINDALESQADNCVVEQLTPQEHMTQNPL